MSASTNLPQLLERFFRVCLVERQDASQNTIRAYRDALVLLLRFAASRAHCDVARLELVHISRDVTLAFLEDLERSRGNSARTRNARLAAVHSFFRFVAEEDPGSMAQARSMLNIPFKRGAQASITCLDRSEIECLLAIPDPNIAGGRRDAALLWFLYNTGARAQEVVDLRIPAVRFDPPAQVRLLGKGRKERLCPLWKETTSLLRTMLRDRDITEQSDEPLFLNAARRPLTRFGLRHIVRNCAGRARLRCPSLMDKSISPHTFRHTTALHLLQSGVELNVVRSWLGHASIETTHAYVEIDMNMKRTALEAVSRMKPANHRRQWQEPDVLRWLEAL